MMIKNDEKSINKLRKSLPTWDFYFQDTNQGNNLQKLNKLVLVSQTNSNSTYQRWAILEDNLLDHRITLRCFLASNGIMLSIKDLGHRLLALRLAAKIQKSNDKIKLQVHPLNGTISYKMSFTYDPTQKRISKNPLFKLLTQQLNRFHYFQTTILFIKEGILKQQNKSLDKNLEKLYGIKKQFQQKMKSLYQIRVNKNLKVPDFKKKPSQLAVDKFYQQHQFFSDKTEKILQMYCDKRKFYDYNLTNFISEKLPTSVKEQYNDDASTEEQPDQIFKRIEFRTLQKDIKWTHLSSGGYGNLSYSRVSYYLSQIGNPQERTQITGYITKKEDKSYNQSKIQHEIKILSSLHNQTHENIKSFYFYEGSSQYYRRCLFSKLEKYLSWDIYLKKFQTSITLLTKLYVLSQITNGLIFLKKNNVVHLDFKPGNILICKGLKAKLIDFGQAIQKGWSDPNNIQAYTFPYSPPETHYKTPIYSQKADVYALGATIFKTIAGRHIHQGAQKKQEFFQALMQNKLKSYLACQHFFQMYGQKNLCIHLVYLCFMCIDPDYQLRPTLEQILAVLQQCRAYLKNIYL